MKIICSIQSQTAIAQEHGTIVAILWHQGETDSKLRNDHYKDDLTAVIANYRKDLNLEDNVPFILGELGSFYDGSIYITEYVDKITKSFYELAEKLPSVEVVKAKDLNHIGDNLHFDAASQHTLGARYYSSLTFC